VASAGGAEGNVADFQSSGVVKNDILRIVIDPNLRCSLCRWPGLEASTLGFDGAGQAGGAPPITTTSARMSGSLWSETRQRVGNLFGHTGNLFGHQIIVSADGNRKRATRGGLQTLVLEAKDFSTWVEVEPDLLAT